MTYFASASTITTPTVRECLVGACKNARTPRGHLCETHQRRAYRFKISAGKLAALLARGTCAICESPRDLVIDHCHNTQKVRETLCRSCNTVVGHIERTGPIDAWGKPRDARCLAYVQRWAARQGVTP